MIPDDVLGGSDAARASRAAVLRGSVEPGLCDTCAMRRRVVTAKGSTFFYCTRADGDPTYVKYPRLPVLFCSGYSRAEGLDAGRVAPTAGETPA